MAKKVATKDFFGSEKREVSYLLTLIQQDDYIFAGMEVNPDGQCFLSFFNEGTLGFIERVGIDFAETLVAQMATKLHLSEGSRGTQYGEVHMAYVFRMGSYYMKICRTTSVDAYGTHHDCALVDIHD